MFKNRNKIKILKTVYPTNNCLRLIGLILPNKTFKYIYLIFYLFKILIDLYLMNIVYKNISISILIDDLFQLLTIAFWLFSLILISINFCIYNALIKFFKNLNLIERKMFKNLQLIIEHDKYKNFFFIFTFSVIIRVMFHSLYLSHRKAVAGFQYFRVVNVLWVIGSEIQTVIYIWSVNMYFIEINKFLNVMKLFKINLLINLSKNFCELCHTYNYLIKLLGATILLHVLLNRYDVALIIFRENHARLDWQHFGNIWAIEPLICIIIMVYSFQNTQNRVSQ